MADKNQNPIVLLHTCCAPCSTASIEKLYSLNYKPVILFSNDNIFPQSEFKKREDEAKKYAELLQIDFLSTSYNHTAWLKNIEGEESAPEGGRRCEKCFLYNLTKANAICIQNGYKGFTTSLTVSRFKNSKKIFEIGSAFENFLPVDFKKQNGFQRSVELATINNMYRQNYCGCEFSMPKVQPSS